MASGIEKKRPWGMLAKCVFCCCAVLAWFAPRWVVRSMRDPARNNGTLSIDTAQFNFGIVEQGESVRHNFRLTNGKSHIIKILKVTSSCSCAVAELDKKELAPGETIDIPVRVDTNGRSGGLLKDVKLVTDDKDDEVIKLELVGEVRMLFAPPSGDIRFSFLREKAAIERFCVTVGGRAQDAELSIAPESVPEYLNVTLKRERGDFYCVTAGLNIAKAPDKFSAKIFLKSPDTKVPPYPIHVSGELQRKFSCLPAQIYLGLANPGEVLHRRMTVWANNDAGAREVNKLQLVPGKSRTYMVAAEIGERKDDHWEVNFKIQIDPSLHAGDTIADAITLEDDHHEQIEIPLKGFIGDQPKVP
jgi:hypothetical protein